MTRALFVNTGMLGHAAFAGLMKDIAARIPWIAARHVDLSRDLTIADRLIRRVFSMSFTPRTGVAANLDLRRWRQEMNIGLLAARRIAAIERQSPVDVLHFHTQAAAYASLARMKRTPAIVSVDCTQRLASLEASSRLGRATYGANIAHDGRVFRAAAAIVATSEWAARDLADLHPDCAARVSVLPFPVDVDAFGADWIAERAVRARTPGGHRARVLFMGGDFPRKGGADLLAAWRDGGFAAVADLEVVTNWPIAPDDIPPGVEVTRGVAPYTSRWLDAWRRADVFAMPARHEAFGIVYEEAAASGIPAIASAINAVPEIISAGATGILVPAGDRQALVDALRVLIDSPVLRERMGRAARSHVTARAAVPVYTAKLASIIGSMVTRDVRQRA